MKASTTQDLLAKVLGIVVRALATRSTLPVLGHVLIEAADGELKLSATNLDIGIVARLRAEVAEAGALTVPGKLLADIVGQLHTLQRVTLATQGTGLDVTCNSFKAHLRAIPAEEFPSIVRDGARTIAQIPAKELKLALTQAAFAAASDDSRPVLAGVQFRFGGADLRLAAADGFRLAVRNLDLPAPADGDATFILPARAMAELARIAGDGDDVVEIAVLSAQQPAPGQLAADAKATQVLFRLPSADLLARVIEGGYPDVARIVPATCQTRVVADTAKLGRAVKTALAVARDDNDIVRLKIDGTGEAGRLTIEATAQTGETVDTLDVAVEGEQREIAIAFNGKYVLDVVGAAGSEQIAIELNAPTAPGAFRPVGAPGQTYVIMPMHTTKK